MQIDATRGSIGETMGKFALPYLFSYFLQTLYGMADLFIIGQFEGAASITAVSIGSQVMHMVTVMLVGLAMGTTVSIAQAVGGGKREQTAWITGNTVTFFLGSSMVLAAGLTFLVHPLAALMHTPAEAVPGTVEYLTLCFLGIPFITAYNIISAIFRGLGNSRSPMVFIAIACAANILLDCLFMGVFHMGPAGAALGTTLSQAISVAISLFMIRRYRLGITLAREQLRPRWEVIRKLLRIGVPIALQDGFIQVAFLVITVIANERGITDAAAVGIVEKIISFIFLVPSSLLSTVSALGAQNIGAHQPERARAILETALKTALGFGVLMDPADAAGSTGLCGDLYFGFRRHQRRSSVPSGIYRGCALCRSPFQFQRLFLRLGPVGIFLYPQCDFHCPGPDPPGLRSQQSVPVYPAAHGPGHRLRLPGFRTHLYGAVSEAETEKRLHHAIIESTANENKTGGNEIQCMRMHVLPNRSGSSWNWTRKRPFSARPISPGTGGRKMMRNTPGTWR